MKKNIAFWVYLEEDNTEMKEYAKKIVQSVQFE